MRRAPGDPAPWDEFTADELACALGESRAHAEGLLAFAHALETRLPGTKAALRDGTIDMVATDHSPCPPEMKQLESGDFFAAWGGIASLQRCPHHATGSRSGPWATW